MCPVWEIKGGIGDSEDKGLTMPNGTYEFIVEKISYGVSESKKREDGEPKRMLRVELKNSEDGEYFGRKVSDTFSIDDEIGRIKFKNFWQAVFDDVYPPEGVLKIDSGDYEGKKLMVTVELDDKPFLPKGAEDKPENYRKGNKNQVARRGYAALGDNSAKEAKPASESKPAKGKAAKPAKTETDDWDK